MTMHPEELTRLVDEALGQLPLPRAPRSLHPRVMAAVTPQIHGRPWFTWSWPAQVAAMVCLAVIVTGVTWLEPRLVLDLTQWVPEWMVGVTAQISAVAETGSAVGRVVQVTWSGVVLPIAKLVLLLTVALCTACAACLAALGRMTPGGVSQT
ncbi:MAG TPA: hypothetical protein VMF13_22465 [Luteitalea sp.]|nr:hypothetical protein [Luteitalea sp.]